MFWRRLWHRDSGWYQARGFRDMMKSMQEMKIEIEMMCTL